MNQINRIFTALLLLAISMAAAAQNATISGVVSDQDGPVIGATVLIKGTTNGTSTDIDGNFTLSNVNADKAVLLVKYVGCADQELPLKGKTSGIEIFMKPDDTMLEEMVVIGYGVMKRGNLTGSMSSIESATLSTVPVTNVGEAIVGRMPGVQVTTPDGSPDAEVSVRIRGGGSITQSNEPLVLIDGFEGSLNDACFGC